MILLWKRESHNIIYESMTFSPTTLAPEVNICCWDSCVNWKCSLIFFCRNTDSFNSFKQRHEIQSNIISSTFFDLTHPMSAIFSFIHQWFQEWTRDPSTPFSLPSIVFSRISCNFLFWAFQTRATTSMWIGRMASSHGLLWHGSSNDFNKLVPLNGQTWLLCQGKW